MLSSREWASLTIILVIIIGLLFSKTVRKPLLGIVPPFLEMLYHKSVLPIHIYVLGILLLLQYFNIVDGDNSITYLVWLSTILYPFLIKNYNRKNNEIDLKVFFGRILSWTFILHFIVATYTMNYFVELIFILFSTFIALLNAVSSRDEKYKFVRKMCEVITGVIGFYLICYSLGKFISNVNDLRDISFWKVLFIELSLILHLPLYFYVKFMSSFEFNQRKLVMKYPHEKSLRINMFLLKVYIKYNFDHNDIAKMIQRISPYRDTTIKELKQNFFREQLD